MLPSLILRGIVDSDPDEDHRVPMVFIARINRFDGTRNQKREPSLGVLLAPTCPPMSCANLATMDSPRPVPPYSRVDEPSICEKG